MMAYRSFKHGKCNKNLPTKIHNSLRKSDSVEKKKGRNLHTVPHTAAK